MNITSEDWEMYEDCRQSGVTNMFMVRNVMIVTNLEKEKVLYIMNNYEELRKKFS